MNLSTISLHIDDCISNFMKYYSPAPIDPVSRVLCQFAPTRCPLGAHWVPTGCPLGAHWVPTGRPVGTHWGPGGLPFCIHNGKKWVFNWQ